MEIQWLLKKFEDLEPGQLYAIMQLRNEVFVVEQNCVFQDADNKDQKSWHLMGIVNEKLIAYSRLLPPGFVYEEPSIGRVVTSPSIRGSGAGKELMEESIQNLFKLFGNNAIRISAQLYLKKFYTSFGFEQVSEVYIEDWIEHINMVKKQNS